MDKTFIDILQKLIAEQGARKSTALSGVDEQSPHGVALNKGYHGEQCAKSLD